MAENYRSPLSPHLVHRQQSRNCVVGKDQVGKPRPSCYDLPPEDYVYGVSESADATGQGVRDALSWCPHVPSPPRRRGVDYQRVNREAANDHVTNAKELAKFRADHDYRLSPPRRGHGPPAVIPSDVAPGYAYGRAPARPSTPPLSAVLAHDYASAAEAARDERYRRYDEERARNAAPLKIKFTKAAGSYRRPPPPESEDPMQLWKMKKFQRVPASSSRHGDSASPTPVARGRARDDGMLPSSSCSASLPELPQARRTGYKEPSPIPSLEEALLAAASDAERETEAGSEAGWRSEADSGSGTPPSAEGQWEGHGQHHDYPEAEDDSTEPEALPEREVALTPEPEQEVTPRPTRRVETAVKLLLTVNHELPEELNAATYAMAGCIRSHFPDSFVRVGEVALEQPRQGIREEHSRYMAWGPGALRSPPSAKKAHAMSPVVLSLSVRHASREELETAQRAIVERIRGYFPEGLVQVRGVRPPLPPAGAREAGAGAGAPSAPGTPGQQVRFREEDSIVESPPLRYPLRPRPRDGQPRRSKPLEAPLSPPKSPWK